MGQLPQGRVVLSSLAFLLRQFGKQKALSDGKRAHNHIFSLGYDSSRFLANWVVQMYGECGSMEDAQAVFERIHSPNIHSWTILLTMYAQNGRLEDAKAVFYRMPDRSVVSWNAMMAAYIQNGSGKGAIGLLYRMYCECVQLDNVSFLCAVDACTSLEEVIQIHVSIAESGYMQDLVIGTALLHMYGRCGSMENARTVFGSIADRDSSCWNAMLAAFTRNKHGKEALDLFCQMQCTGIKPDVVTFVCVLDGCASLSALVEGHVIHASIVDNEIEVDHILGTALVDMYGKCGSMHDAVSMFSRTPHENVISWNAIIGVFAQNGHGKEALNLFYQMQLECIEPDYATFISILTACSHAGLVNLGWYFFLSMCRDYGIQHNIDHFACMIDLLGRAGHLDEAEHLLNKIPLEVDDVTWRSLLGACKIHGDVERGMRTANKCLALDPEDAAPYVALLNIHAVACNLAWGKTHVHQNALSE